MTEKDCLIKNGVSRTSSEKQQQEVNSVGPKFVVEKTEETKKIRFEVVKIINKAKEAENLASDMSEAEVSVMEIDEN